MTKMLTDDTKPVPEDLSVQVSSEGICSSAAHRGPMPLSGHALGSHYIWEADGIRAALSIKL